MGFLFKLDHRVEVGLRHAIMGSFIVFTKRDGCSVKSKMGLFGFSRSTTDVSVSYLVVRHPYKSLSVQVRSQDKHTSMPGSDMSAQFEDNLQPQQQFSS